jgi:peptidyl-prolyl cis-trans isomerase D
MMSWLRKHRRAFFIAVVAIFLMGTFVGLGGYLFTSRDTQTSVATVGSAKIEYGAFIRRVNQYVENARERGVEVTDQMTKEVKQETLRDMIVDEILEKKADELGITVTDEELARDIQNTPAFQRGGQFDTDQYFSTVYRVFRDTPQAYETNRRKSMKAYKLKQLIFQTAKITPQDLREAYAREHKGDMKAFEKQKGDFEARLQQQRAIELINYYLRQVSQQIEIRSFLEQRESGV